MQRYYSKEKAIIMEYCLNDFTGQTLQEFLINEVDNKWVVNQEKVYKFYQTQHQNREDKQTFTIQVAGIPDSQPGNGKVEFRKSDGNYYGHTHRYLYEEYSSADFPELRKKYLDDNLGNVAEDNILAANVLLSFEVARRVQSEDHTKLLTRSEVAEAIKRVMTFSEDVYSAKVSK